MMAEKGNTAALMPANELPPWANDWLARMEASKFLNLPLSLEAACELLGVLYDETDETSWPPNVWKLWLILGMKTPGRENIPKTGYRALRRGLMQWPSCGSA